MVVSDQEFKRLLQEFDRLREETEKVALVIPRFFNEGGIAVVESLVGQQSQRVTRMEQIVDELKVIAQQ